jgi:hypothetical protein
MPTFSDGFHPDYKELYRGYTLFLLGVASLIYRYVMKKERKDLLHFRKSVPLQAKFCII